MFTSISLAFLIIITFPLVFKEEVSFFLPTEELKNPYFFLAVGKDREIEGTVRTDAIVVGVADWKKKTLTLVSIPRDTLIDGRKINSFYNEGGISKLLKVVENLLNVRFDGYVVLNYEAFKILGDELGPVKVVPNEVMYYVDKVQDLVIDFKPGVPYYLDGKQLLAYIRYRKDATGDLARIERQKEVFKKLVQAALEKSFADLAKVLEKLEGQIETNVKVSDLFFFYVQFSEGLEVRTHTIPYRLDRMGNVLVDEREIASFMANVAVLPERTEKPLKVVLVNVSSRISRVFDTEHRDLWKKIAGQEPVRIVWESTDLEKMFDGNQVFLLQPDDERVPQLLQEIYPTRKFVIRKFLDKKDFSDYLLILQKLSQRAIYLDFPLTAIVLLDDQ